MIDAECVVIGAGVIGIACARAIQLKGVQTVLLERQRAVGQETSSHNSEVVHSGLYYTPGSRKAILCVQGRRLLTEYCERRGVPLRRLGKLIVAVDLAEEVTLDRYEALAKVNEVARDDSDGERLMRLDSAGVRAMEPALQVHGALWVPQTGIVDSAALMDSLLQDFEEAGGDLVLDCTVKDGAIDDAGLEIELDDAEQTRVRTKRLINCGGFRAPAIARTIRGFSAEHVPNEHFAIGHYFLLSGRSPFQHLVYPVAVPGGLGIHVTLDMAGMARLGPDVEWRPEADYRFDESRAPQFYEAVRRYYPDLKDGALRPGYTGIRPKLSGPGEPPADFVIQGESVHGIPGLVHLFGIESPGLTSSLAIADTVRDMLA